MNPIIQAYWILLVFGIVMLGAEIFLPGGVLGMLGGVCLVSAAAVGFWAFGPQLGFLSLLGIVVCTGIGLAIWIRFFPRTVIGQRLELKRKGDDFKSYSNHRALIGKTGVAASVLRPSGIAMIDGRRVDVVADGDWIEQGSPIIVTKVEGPRIEVRRVESTQNPAPENKRVV